MGKGQDDGSNDGAGGGRRGSGVSEPVLGAAEGETDSEERTGATGSDVVGGPDTETSAGALATSKEEVKAGLSLSIDTL